jgi:hypothetical protein
VEALNLAAGLRVVGLECLETMPKRSSSDSSRTRPLRDPPLKTAALSVRREAGKPNSLAVPKNASRASAALTVVKATPTR